jgi:hypothetical protein
VDRHPGTGTGRGAPPTPRPEADQVLRRIVRAALSPVDAEYGVIGAGSRFPTFATEGVEEATTARTGRPPQSHRVPGEPRVGTRADGGTVLTRRVPLPVPRRRTTREGAERPPGRGCPAHASGAARADPGREAGERRRP